MKIRDLPHLSFYPQEFVYCSQGRMLVDPDGQCFSGVNLNQPGWVHEPTNPTEFWCGGKGVLHLPLAPQGLFSWMSSVISPFPQLYILWDATLTCTLFWSFFFAAYTKKCLDHPVPRPSCPTQSLGDLMSLRPQVCFAVESPTLKIAWWILGNL